MNLRILRVLAISALVGMPLAHAALAQSGPEKNTARETAEGGVWRFAVSGDSRNCGDVVMPAIAAGVKQKSALFYWHLGDFRAINNFDEDIQHQPERVAKPLTIDDYEEIAWDDFLQSQIAPFGALPVYLGIGNHDTVSPHTREQYIIQFADWLDSPTLRAQRLGDDPKDRRLRTYYHWSESGVDFINLDNATEDQFDAAQMKWFESVLQKDASNPAVHTIVVGMHEALPESISRGHSMNQSPVGTESGLRVYRDLLKVQKEAHKRVYVIASHSHYFMEGTFNTKYWRANGGVLPGWIVGTAGAVRYLLPKESSNARAAETNVYGFLLATVKPDDEIDFKFERVNESDVPSPVVEKYTPQFVQWCFAENRAAH